MKPERWRDFAAAAVAILPGPLLAMMVTTMAPVMPAIASHFGAHGWLLVQYLAAIAGIGVAVGAPIAGQAVDRIGFRLVTFVSLAVFTVAGVSGAFFDSPAALLTARFIAGLAAGGLSASSMALIGRRWEGAARARLLGYVTAFGAAVGILSLIIAGFVGQTFGWRATFLLYILAAPTMLLAFSLPAERSGAAREPAPPMTMADWRRLAPLLVGCTAFYVVLFTATIQFPLLLADAGFAKAGERSLLLAAQSMFGMLAGASFGWIRQRLGARRMMSAVLLIFVAGLAAMSLTSGVATALASCFLCGFGMGLMPPNMSHLLLEQAAPEIQGRAGAAMISLRYIAQFMNPVIIGSVGVAIGLRPTLLIISGLIFVVFIARAARTMFARPASSPA